MNQLTGTISVYCRAPDSCRDNFSVRITDSAGKVCVSSRIQANRRVTFFLAQGQYTVKIRSCTGLNPGGVTEWVCVAPGACCPCDALFLRPLKGYPTAKVRIKASDAVYPGITAINGGVTVWLHKITPLPL